MKFATATKPPRPLTPDVANVALLYAFILVVMAVAQLFSFEKFIPLIESFWLPGGHGTAALIASLIVITEVFAMPFLLRMQVSPLMRIMSMVCGWLVALLWLGLTIWVNMHVNALNNIGLFGASIQLLPGWWAVTFSLSLGILAGWATWGMWPLKRLTTHR